MIDISKVKTDRILVLIFTGLFEAVHSGDPGINFCTASESEPYGQRNSLSATNGL